MAAEQAGERASVIVIGGGVAGLASAWALARRGHRVTLLEQERTTGRHASGRNAGLVRRLVDEPALAALGRRGADLLLDPPGDLAPGPLYRPTGSTLVAGGAELPGLLAAVDEARAAGVEVETLDACAVEPSLLGLAPRPGDVAARTPRDGVADPGQLLGALLGACARLGVEVRTSVRARLVDGRPGAVRVRAGDATLGADAVVLAGGPWGPVADVELTAIPLRPLRRHLLLSAPLAVPARTQGWVWDLSRGLYLRPETPGLLLCACDEELRPPEDARPADDAAARLAEVVVRAAPALAGLAVARVWAGLRTFAPDRRFVVGRDPLAPGAVWAAGLGGHGLTAGLAVGELVVRAVEGAEDPLLDALGPARFLAAGSLEPGRA